MYSASVIFSQKGAENETDLFDCAGQRGNRRDARRTSLWRRGEQHGKSCRFQPFFFHAEHEETGVI